jgi:hypothetical protein
MSGEYWVMGDEYWVVSFEGLIMRIEMVLRISTKIKSPACCVIAFIGNLNVLSRTFFYLKKDFGVAYSICILD